ncbi:ribbon-helix-helix domain-containing protein [Saccharolobus islandicus]|uniref:Uncharacterized protein n=1 Tax=Saccharolobus islandicus (strain M.16.4 / Kamchatka \|nr:CopG family transcriptional regulator [Sulfolobus islandicus]ACR41952.1 hypothetical protein M164_1346 [Sulfolobus islandicus M.16.4]
MLLNKQKSKLKKISVYLDEETYNRIDTFAKEHGLSTATLIRLILSIYSDKFLDALNELIQKDLQLKIKLQKQKK